MNELINFAWSAMAGGAFYDGIKALLGTSFNRLHQHYTQQERAEFEQTLEILLDNNQQLRQNLAALAQGNSRSVNIRIQTGNIRANGNVNIGNHNGDQ